MERADTLQDARLVSTADKAELADRSMSDVAGGDGSARGLADRLVHNLSTRLVCVSPCRTLVPPCMLLWLRRRSLKTFRALMRKSVKQADYKHFGLTEIASNELVIKLFPCSKVWLSC